MRERGLDPRDQLLAVEQLADRDRRLERGGIAALPGARAEVGVEIGGGRDAAGERTRARLQQHRLGRGEHLEARRYLGRLTRIGHVARGILEADDTLAEAIEQA